MFSESPRSNVHTPPQSRVNTPPVSPRVNPVASVVAPDGEVVAEPPPATTVDALSGSPEVGVAPANLAASKATKSVSAESLS